MPEQPSSLRKVRSFRLSGVGKVWPTGVLVVALLLVFFLSLIRAATGRVGEPACRATCRSNLGQIGLACQMYADDNDGEFPPGLKELFPTYVDNARVYRCPSADASYIDFLARQVTSASSGYVYVPGGRTDMSPPLIVAHDKLGNHAGKKELWRTYPDGRNVLFSDASVEWWPDTREAEFQERLRKQREAVKKWRDAGANREHIDRFFGELEPGQ